MEKKQWLPKLRPLAAPLQWQAFEEMLDNAINAQLRKLEQAVEPIDIYRAQGAIQSLKTLRYLKQEIDAC
jgi:hypothetical protein